MKEIIDDFFECLNNRDMGYFEHKGDTIYLSGGMSWGDNPTDSITTIQKFNYLPEVATDSIFAVIAEELGFMLSVGVAILFLVFTIRALRIATGSPDQFGRLLGVGIATWIGFQAFVNIGAMLSLLPLTGIPLPFISYGSSSLVTLFAAVGILLNISRQRRGRAESAIR